MIIIHTSIHMLRKRIIPTSNGNNAWYTYDLIKAEGLPKWIIDDPCFVIIFLLVNPIQDFRRNYQKPEILNFLMLQNFPIKITTETLGKYRII